MVKWNKRGMHIERTITVKYYIYKFINYEQNIYMNVTWLKLVLGVPLTYFYHLSAFLQVWSSQPSLPLHGSGYTGTGRKLESSHLYNQIVMMSVEQIICGKL